MRSLWGKRDDLIERLCRESGRWLLIDREHDRYWVRANDHLHSYRIVIR